MRNKTLTQIITQATDVIESKWNGGQTVVFEGVLDVSQFKRDVGCVVRCAVEDD